MKIKYLSFIGCLLILIVFNTSCKSKKVIAKPAEVETVTAAEPLKVVEPIDTHEQSASSSAAGLLT
jgi:hypothetical protein